jgi:hypothetical protein
VLVIPGGIPGGGDRRIIVSGQPKQKVIKTLSQKQARHAYNPSYAGGEGRRIIIQGQPCQKCETLSVKQTKNKVTWSMAQVVEHLTEFNPSTTERTRERKRDRERERTTESTTEIYHSQTAKKIK